MIHGSSHKNRDSSGAGSDSPSSSWINVYQLLRIWRADGYGVAALNNEVGMIVTLALVVLVIGLVFVFSDNIGSEIGDILAGGENGGGLLECDVTTGENCQTGEVEDTGFKPESKEVIGV